MRLGRDLTEEARAGQVVRHDLAHAGRDLGIAVKGRDGDGHRLDHAVGDLDAQGRVLRHQRPRRQQGRRQGDGQNGGGGEGQFAEHDVISTFCQ